MQELDRSKLVLVHKLAQERKQELEHRLALVHKLELVRSKLLLELHKPMPCEHGAEPRGLFVRRSLVLVHKLELVLAHILLLELARSKLLCERGS